MQTYVTYANMCAKMADNITDLPSAPSCSGRVGRPQKYAQPWITVTQRVYLEDNTFSVLKLLKSQQHFTSDDATVQWLISRNEYLYMVERLVIAWLGYEDNFITLICFCSIAASTSDPIALGEFGNLMGQDTLSRDLELQGQSSTGRKQGHGRIPTEVDNLDKNLHGKVTTEQLL